MNLDLVVALEKRATLFSYSRSVEHIVHFYFLRDFDIGMHHLLEFETHCSSNLIFFSNKKICGTRYYLSFLATQFENVVHFYLYLLFLAAQLENIVHFYFLRTLILVGTIFPLKIDMHLQGIQIY